MVPVFTIVTGNLHKLKEYHRLLPADFAFEAADIDLDEIQSFDAVKIVQDKAKRAYDLIGSPVIVEDVSAGLDRLNGLPGPFIKFFEQQLGKDALYKLAGDQTRATVRCTIGYYDGEKTIIAGGTVKGTVVPSRGENGFGFDHVFMPDGQNKTFAEMIPEEKDKLSHRSLAVADLLEQLKGL